MVYLILDFRSQVDVTIDDVECLNVWMLDVGGWMIKVESASHRLLLTEREHLPLSDPIHLRSIFASDTHPGGIDFPIGQSIQRVIAERGSRDRHRGMPRGNCRW
jgi:hypothetical protein